MSKIQHKFTCYIIGEESLAIQCAELILSQGHQLLGIISSKSDFKEWAFHHAVPYIEKNLGYENLLLKTRFDYLFSIVNESILSPILLKQPKYLSINYHDALLPRYAGVNATSWAILNQEKQHGITWHVMAEQIDAGDILKQAVVSIEAHETAFSLNLKCYQAAIEAFKELLLELSERTYTHIPQNLAQRTYYPPHQKLTGNGWIGWNHSAETFDKFYRAMKFGEYPNRLSCLKLQIGKQIYMIDELKALSNPSTQPPGSLVALDEGLQVATQTNDILVTRIKTLDNSICDIRALIQQHRLKPGKKLPSPTDKLQTAYQQISTAIFKHERFWVQQLLLFKPVALPFAPTVHQTQYSHSKCLFTFKLSEKLQTSLQEKFSLDCHAHPLPRSRLLPRNEMLATTISRVTLNNLELSVAALLEEILFTMFLVYLYRISSEGMISISFTDSALLEKSQPFPALLASFIPFNVFFEPSVNFSTALKIVKQQYYTLQQRQTYLEDVYVRYPELNQAHCLASTALCLIFGNSLEEIPQQKCAYPIIVSIQKNTLSLYMSPAVKNENLRHFLTHIPGHLQTLLEDVAQNVDKPVSCLSLLTSMEKQQILIDWNKTQKDYPRDKTVHQLFKEQVSRAPHHIAVVFENDQLTYQQLDKKSDHLAWYLHQQGVKAGMPIAICLERGIEMIISMLGIIKAGAVYLPLDPAYPAKRIQYIMEDSQARFILIQENNIKLLSADLKEKAILFEHALDNNLKDKPFNIQKIPSNSPLYFMYTSGSTGVPKGVVVLHRNIVNLVKNANCIDISEFDSVAQTSNITFDTAMFEIWGTLLNGGKLIIMAKHTLLSSEAFKNTIVQQKISVLWLTTALFNQLYALNPEAFYLVNYLMIGGEKLNSEVTGQFIHYRKNKPKAFLNGYGPTETTVFATCYLIDDAINSLSSIPIGKPLSNTQCYVLDSHLQPVPVGVVGELFIGGEGVSAGYLNQPEKTQQNFIANPFVSTHADRLYRSGDKVRWLPDGNLEYIGRGDDQIKLRGFRIELGEIEAALAKHPQISQAIVCLHGTDEQRKQLEAYIVCEKNPSSHPAPLDTEKLAAYLKNTLPDYMIPAQFFVVEHFPLTINGKVDKATLMTYRPSSSFDKKVKEANSPTEVLLVEIWQNVLKIPAISTDESFFSLGGDSIIAMQIVAKANQSGMQLAVQDIFQYPTIGDLAKRMTHQNADQKALIQVNQKFNLAPIQSWFFEQDFAHKEYFSQVALLNVSLPIDIKLLEHCFEGILRHHDALRLRFNQQKGVWQQYYTEAKKTAYKLIEAVNSSHCHDAALTELIEQWTDKLQQAFNLENGPLLKAALFSGHAKDSGQLLIVAHHLTIDGVSWRIFLEELQSLYQSFSSPKKLTEPAIKSSSYQAWINSLTDGVNLDHLADEALFWSSVDQKFCPLPIDYQQGENLEKYTASISVCLSEEETENWLKKLSFEQGIKPHEILIALLAKTLAAWTKFDSVIFDLESHGREPLFAPLNLSQTIGWFTSLFPVYLRVPNEATLLEIAQSIQQQLQKIPHQGISYGLLRYLKQKPFLHQAQVAFNYLGQFDQIFDQDHFKFDSLKLVSHPENRRSYLLNVDGIVKNHQLTISWTYSTCFHRAETIKQLAENYIEDLRKLIKSDHEMDGHTVDCSLLKCSFAQIKPYLTDVENILAIYPLSPMQQGLLFHAIHAPNSEAYKVQLLWRIPTGLNIDALIQTWQFLIKRHEILRTSFVWEGLDTPVQVVKKSAELVCTQYNWSNSLDKNTREQRLTQFLQADRQVGFDFNYAPLFRLILIELPKKQYYLVATCHHILLDGWSLSILINELNYVYREISHKNTPSLPQPKSYRHYLKWLQEKDSYATESFWRNYLNDFSAPTDLGIVSTHNYQTSHDGKVDSEIDEQRLSDELIKQLKQFCQAHQLTLNTLFQGAWALLLNRYSQSDDVLFGVTSAGRSAEIAGSEDMVGLFINTMPLRINFSETISAKDYLMNIQNDSLQINQHQYISLTDLQAWSKVPNGTPLFDSILVFENYPITENEDHWLNLSNTKIIDPTHYPLSCIVIPGNKFIIRLAYDKNVITKESIQRLQGHLKTLLVELTTYPQKSIHQLNLVTKKEYQQILMDWNKTQVNYPLSKTVHQLFEEQVEKTPDHIAVVFEDLQLTYRQLNEKANQLARHLKKRGIKPEKVAAILMDRSLEMIVAILGTLKAGGAYLPIDMKYPRERIRYILQDSCAVLLLTQEPLWKPLHINDFDQDKLVFVEQETLFSKESVDNLNLKVASHQLMYVIYTSGSTGTPKGVLVEHRSVVNLLTAMYQQIKPVADDIFLALTPIIFDISGLELYLPLIVGARCIIANSETATDGYQLKETIIRNKISIIQATPMTWKMLIEAGWGGSASIKVLCGGEALSKKLAKQLVEKTKHFWNLYGPTETTIWSTINYISHIDENIPVIPIGKPLANTKVYVLNSANQPVPVGICGELHISGEGLARGYLNRSELTAEKFITDPFNQNARLYRTGDLVKWLPDGNLEYLGRMDDQVKINGFRMELGEIQSQLEKHPSVLHATIISQENTKGEKYLLAYIINQPHAKFDEQELRNFLQQFFPYAMIPSVFIALDKFPLTPSGKLDKKALPVFAEQSNLSRNYVAPRNKQEKMLTDIWSEILNVSKISIHDDFFALGAHSLSALQLLAKIRHRFKINLQMQALFENTTIHKLVHTLELMQFENKALSAATHKSQQNDLEACLVTLQPEGNKTPLFLIHPIGGTVFWYIPLVKYLDRDRPLYAIQDPGIEMDSVPFSSVQEMASFYIKTIKAVQPCGPYLLGGASAGGNISVEMSHQLELEGEKVIFIGLLDGWAFYPTSLQNREFFETVMRKQYHDMQNIFMTKGIDKAERLLKLQWERSKMNHVYTVPYVFKKLTLFKPTKTLDIFATMDSPFNHWEKYSSLPVEAHIVPGDHETMFQEPNVAVLGEKLNECLKRCEAFYKKDEVVNE